ncbi:hypothetical protein [Wolbachia endosymbiont of Wuchereria bancrofti]|nr:hypothetical protein [Wolbachia endosymbiont of Wuchereria bancrofti]OWZ25592.1 hypothetical protein CCY16_00659 [Wolbachia endosymbiont of Wuchereria bancrofti]
MAGVAMSRKRSSAADVETRSIIIFIKYGLKEISTPRLMLSATLL